MRIGEFCGRINRTILFSILACFVITAFSSPAQALYLVRRPFIQSCSYDSAVIVWRTMDYARREKQKPDVHSVQYSEDESFDKSVEPQVKLIVTTDDSGNGVQHEATITGLKPGTLYHYRVISKEEVMLHNGIFRTASTGKKFSFLVLGDSGKGDREDDGQWGVARRINEYVKSCDLAIGMGDHVQNEPQSHDYQRFFFDYYQEWLSYVPFYPVRGNHEYDWLVDPRSGYRTVNFDLAFVVPNANPGKIYDYGRPLEYGEPEVYYKVDYGNAVFLALDVPGTTFRRGTKIPHCSTWHEGTSQHNWLVKELKEARRLIDAGKKDWLFVYFHIGPYTYYGHGNKTDIEAHLVPYFEKYGVDVVFNGHTHAYERTWPLKEKKKVTEKEGVVYLTTGGAGPDFYARRTAHGETFLEEELLAYHEQCHHFVVADVDGRKLRFRAIRWDGKIIDTYEYQK